MRRFFCGSFLLVMLRVGVCCAVVSIPCSNVVTCWERADLLASMFVVLCHFPKCVLGYIRIKGEVCAVSGLSPPVKYFLLTVTRRFLFCGSFVLFMSYFVMLSRPFIATCWERTDLLPLVCDVLLCFVTFQCGILGQVWYLIVSIPDLCHLSYFDYIYWRNISVSTICQFKTFFF